MCLQRAWGCPAHHTRTQKYRWFEGLAGIGAWQCWVGGWRRIHSASYVTVALQVSGWVSGWAALAAKPAQVSTHTSWPSAEEEWCILLTK